MSNKPSVAVSTVVSSSSTMSSAVGGKSLTSDNLEISLIDTKTGTKMKVEGLSECSIKFTMNAVSKTDNATFDCVYFNPDQNVYRSEGCKLLSSTKVKTNQYKLSCCCTHLSLFSTSQSLSSTQKTLPDMSTESLDQAVGQSRLVFALFSIIFMLAYLLFNMEIWIINNK